MRKMKAKVVTTTDMIYTTDPFSVVQMGPWFTMQAAWEYSNPLSFPEDYSDNKHIKQKEVAVPVVAKLEPPTTPPPQLELVITTPLPLEETEAPRIPKRRSRWPMEKMSGPVAAERFATEEVVPPKATTPPVKGEEKEKPAAPIAATAQVQVQQPAAEIQTPIVTVPPTLIEETQPRSPTPLTTIDATGDVMLQLVGIAEKPGDPKFLEELHKMYVEEAGVLYMNTLIGKVPVGSLSIMPVHDINKVLKAIQQNSNFEILSLMSTVPFESNLRIVYMATAPLSYLDLEFNTAFKNAIFMRGSTVDDDYRDALQLYYNRRDLPRFWYEKYISHASYEMTSPVGLQKFCLGAVIEKGKVIDISGKDFAYLSGLDGDHLIQAPAVFNTDIRFKCIDKMQPILLHGAPDNKSLLVPGSDSVPCVNTVNELVFPKLSDTDNAFGVGMLSAAIFAAIQQAKNAGTHDIVVPVDTSYRYSASIGIAAALHMHDQWVTHTEYPINLYLCNTVSGGGFDMRSVLVGPNMFEMSGNTGEFMLTHVYKCCENIPTKCGEPLQLVPCKLYELPSIATEKSSKPAHSSFLKAASMSYMDKPRNRLNDETMDFLKAFWSDVIFYVDTEWEKGGSFSGKQPYPSFDSALFEEAKRAAESTPPQVGFSLMTLSALGLLKSHKELIGKCKGCYNDYDSIVAMCKALSFAAKDGAQAIPYAIYLKFAQDPTDSKKYVFEKYDTTSYLMSLDSLFVLRSMVASFIKTTPLKYLLCKISINYENLSTGHAMIFSLHRSKDVGVDFDLEVYDPNGERYQETGLIVYKLLEDLHIMFPDKVFKDKLQACQIRFESKGHVYGSDRGTGMQAIESSKKSEAQQAERALSKGVTKEIYYEPAGYCTVHSGVVLILGYVTGLPISVIRDDLIESFTRGALDTIPMSDLVKSHLKKQNEANIILKMSRGFTDYIRTVSRSLANLVNKEFHVSYCPLCCKNTDSSKYWTMCGEEGEITKPTTS